ncbi:Large ribosomal subunit protein [Trichinella spiralis]|uniref:Large ribosomal subunit protein mL52 n=1 Tax=Trichinella spiralis TaxID=6334 RepID=A0ABR3KYN0_TRISP
MKNISSVYFSFFRNYRFWTFRKPTNGHWAEADRFLESPDWSYSGGQPSPTNTAERKRLLMQKNLARKIIQSLNEIHQAKEAYAKLTVKKRQEELDRLPPFRQKGHKIQNKL